MTECLCGEQITSDEASGIGWTHVETDDERCYPEATDVGSLSLLAEPVES